MFPLTLLIEEEDDDDDDEEEEDDDDDELELAAAVERWHCCKCLWKVPDWS